MGVRIAISSKYAQKQLWIVKDLAIKGDGVLMEAMDRNGWRAHGGKVLVVVADDEQDACMKHRVATQEDRSVQVLTTSEMTTYAILCHDHLVVTAKAVSLLADRYNVY
jgi:ribosomal protein L4